MKHTPRGSGYRMPAEWEPQSAVWLSWPSNPETWPEPLLSGVRRVYVEVVEAMSAMESVCMLVDDEAAEREVQTALEAAQVRASAVSFYRIPTADVWIRDYGPTFLIHRDSGQAAMVQWEFNAWGGKYEDLTRDDSVPAAIQAELNLPIFNAGMVMEGGAIDVNGCGTVLTTEQCLLNRNRNPQLDRSDVEGYLREFLEVSNVLWLGEGIAGDDTDGHVDDVARFVDERTVVAAYEDDPAEENYAQLRDNLERLQSMKDQDGRALRVVPIPMPDPVVGPEGRLPATYANFYIGNRAVIVPVFGQDKDRLALDVVQSCFPGRRVIGIDCTAMVYGLGTIHCCTQQQPRATQK